MSAIAAAAQLACVDIYEPVNMAAFDKVYRVGETVCGTKLIGNTMRISMQGTDTRAGWRADLDVMPFYHPALGNLHSGFYQNLPALLKQLTPDIPQGVEVLVTGHSKGAGEGSQLAALLKLSGFNVLPFIVFACPNAGYQRFADWIAENLPGSLSFRNAPDGFPEFGDPVACVPLHPYVPPVPHTMIDVAPPGFECALDVMWHEAALYQAGATAWELAQT
jgi:hypothetical protein